MTAHVNSESQSRGLAGRISTVSSRTLLCLIVVIAIGLRMGSAVFQGNDVNSLPGTQDQISYDSLARRVLDGYGFSFAEGHWPLTRAGEPTAHWSFLYTFYLVGLYGAFGTQPIIARLIQALIVGGLQTYMTYRLGERVFSKSVGLIAASISALYIYFIYYSGSLMTEPFYITAILFSLFITIKLGEETNKREEIKLSIFLGIALSITVLMRQVFLLFIPFLFFWLWVTRFRRRLSLPLVSTILSLGLVVLFIIPFSMYNESRFGRFVLLNTNSGYAFFWANHPIYGTHFSGLLPKTVSYQELIPVEVRSLDEASLDQALLQRGLQFVFDDPKRYILLSLSRIPVYFQFWPSVDSGLISNVSRIASFGIALPFMLYGLFLAVKRTFSELGSSLIGLFTSPIGLLLLFIFIYSSIHLLSWALIRYRLPVDAVLILFAALAVQEIFWVVRKHVVSTSK